MEEPFASRGVRECRGLLVKAERSTKLGEHRPSLQEGEGQWRQLHGLLQSTPGPGPWLGLGSDEKALASDLRPSRAACKIETFNEAGGAPTFTPERRGGVAPAAAEVEPGAGPLRSARKKVRC